MHGCPLRATVFFMNLIRVVFDTNVILDFLYFNNPNTSALLTKIQNREIEAIYSEETLFELRDVLSRSQFKLTQQTVDRLIESWTSIATKYDMTQSASTMCLDSDDQKFLNLALSAQAQYLVSRDKLVLRCRKKSAKEGFFILTPEKLIESLNMNA